MMDGKGGTGADAPLLTVIIPTRDRPTQLAATLAAVLAQPEVACEAIVVDDGSLPPVTTTSVVRLFRQEPRGPAAARNLAIQHARGERVLLLGDDTPPAPGALSRHVCGEFAGVALQGRIDWHPERPITPVMAFLAPCGPQFYFAGLRAGADVPYASVLGSNLSLPTDWLRQEPFDERFRGATFEDTELAFRWMRRGWRVLYDPDALCWHEHHYPTLEPFLERQRRAGAAARLAVRLHPALFGRTVALPALVGLRTLLRLAGARLSGRADTRRAEWDWRCRVAFLHGFLGGG